MPITFSFDWKSFLCLALKGYSGCSAGAVIWQGNRLALLLLLSGPVVLLISCLHSSRAVSLPPERGVRPFLSRGWWGLQRAGITSVLSAPHAHRLVCQAQKLWPGKRLGSAAGELHCSCSCAWVLGEHLFRRQLLCDDGQRKHHFCGAKWNQARWICPSDTASAASRGKKHWI